MIANKLYLFLCLVGLCTNVQGQSSPDTLSLSRLLSELGGIGYQITLDSDLNGTPDTVVSRFSTAYWSAIARGEKSPVGLYGTSFDIKPSPINGVGLFTKADKTYQNGDIILLIFFKIRNTGNFRSDYIETPQATFINDSQDAANTRIELCADGIRIVATTTINGGTELLSSYRQLIDLFPGDSSVESTVKYW
jgi:hypothetical protein